MVKFFQMLIIYFCPSCRILCFLSFVCFPSQPFRPPLPCSTSQFTCPYDVRCLAALYFISLLLTTPFAPVCFSFCFSFFSFFFLSSLSPLPLPNSPWPIQLIQGAGIVASNWIVPAKAWGMRWLCARGGRRWDWDGGRWSR